LILVELINDSTGEDYETLFLGIYNPLGGSFGGLKKLTAIRTIVDDLCLECGSVVNFKMSISVCATEGLVLRVEVKANILALVPRFA